MNKMLLKSALALALFTGIYGKSDLASRSLLAGPQRVCLAEDDPNQEAAQEAAMKAAQEEAMKAKVARMKAAQEKARKEAEQKKAALMSELEKGYAGLSNTYKVDVDVCKDPVVYMVKWFDDAMIAMSSEDTKKAVTLCSAIIDASPKCPKEDKDKAKMNFAAKLKQKIWEKYSRQELVNVFPKFKNPEDPKNFKEESQTLMREIITEAFYPVIKEMAVDKLMDVFKKKVDSGKVTKDQKDTLVKFIDMTDKTFGGATFDDFIDSFITQVNDDEEGLSDFLYVSDELAKTIKEDVKSYKKKVRATANGDWSTGAIVAVIVIPIVAVAVIAGGVTFYMKKK